MSTIAELQAEISKLKETLRATIDTARKGEELRRAEIAGLRAELESTKPEWDTTDGAHPCWWRGHDNGANGMRAKMEKEIAGLRELLRAYVQNVTCPARFSTPGKPAKHADCGTCLTCRTYRALAAPPVEPQEGVTDDPTPAEILAVIQAKRTPTPDNSFLAPVNKRLDALDADVQAIRDNERKSWRQMDTRVKELETHAEILDLRIGRVELLDARVKVLETGLDEATRRIRKLETRVKMLTDWASTFTSFPVPKPATPEPRQAGHAFEALFDRSSICKHPHCTQTEDAPIHQPPKGGAK